MGTDAEPEQPSEVKRTRKNLFLSGKLYSDTSMSQCASHTHQIVCGYVCVLYIKHRVYRKEKRKNSAKNEVLAYERILLLVSKSSHSVDIWQERLSHKWDLMGKTDLGLPGLSSPDSVRLHITSKEQLSVTWNDTTLASVSHVLGNMMRLSMCSEYAEYSMLPVWSEVRTGNTWPFTQHWLTWPFLQLNACLSANSLLPLSPVKSPYEIRVNSALYSLYEGLIV